MGKGYREQHKLEEQKYALREADWRNGAIVYQVFVDRFAQSEDLESKRHLYTFPQRLRDWSEVPSHGTFLPEYGVWTQELDFWGGDLKSLRAKLDYLVRLGIDVLYLNPIQAAFTNHKYDTSDYMQIAPEYGTKTDLIDLINDLHRLNIKIILDGVFNHVGRNSSLFKEAESSPESPYREWFYFGRQYPHGARLWANAQNLPELNFENPAVREFIYEGEQSVVRSYLSLGIDGWRLDTATELGFNYLAELTDNAHAENSESLIVGEIWNYPADWIPTVDGVLNFSLRNLIIECLQGTISPAMSNEMIARLIEDTGMEGMLKSWILLENHDLPRITTVLPHAADQQIARVLQFTLPGSPNLYYGGEIGMEGGRDPANRAPMRWDLLEIENSVFQHVTSLVRLRKNSRALRVGDYRKVFSEKLIAFERYTDRTGESVIVVVNPTDKIVEENLFVPDSRFMNGTRMVDLLDDEREFFTNVSLLRVNVAAKSSLILKPQIDGQDRYNPYKRID